MLSDGRKYHVKQDGILQENVRATTITHCHNFRARTGKLFEGNSSRLIVEEIAGMFSEKKRLVCVGLRTQNIKTSPFWKIACSQLSPKDFVE